MPIQKRLAPNPLTTALHELSSLIYAAGFSNPLAVIALSIPDCPARLRLDTVPARDLKEGVARQIRNCLRQGDLLFQIDTWEWLCILPNLPGEAAGQFAMEKFRKVIDNLYVELKISRLQAASFGLAMLHAGGDESAYLVQSARIAMNYARNQGHLMEVYSRKMEGEASVSHAIDNQIIEALTSNDGISLQLEPKLDLRSRTCIGVEVHPCLTLSGVAKYSPAQILASVRRLGLASLYARWLFNNAARTHGALKSAGVAIEISLNLSLSDLEDDELPDMLVQILALHGMVPAEVLLEIDIDASPLASMPPATRRIQRLHQNGFKISLDGFGSGHADLCVLTTLPVCEIKIPQAMLLAAVTSAHSREVVKALSALAKVLAIKIVALDIESQELHAEAVKIGFDCVQGRYLTGLFSLTDFVQTYAHGESAA